MDDFYTSRSAHVAALAEVDVDGWRAYQATTGQICNHIACEADPSTCKPCVASIGCQNCSRQSPTYRCSLQDHFIQWKLSTEAGLSTEEATTFLYEYQGQRAAAQAVVLHGHGYQSSAWNRIDTLTNLVQLQYPHDNALHDAVVSIHVDMFCRLICERTHTANTSHWMTLVGDVQDMIDKGGEVRSLAKHLDEHEVREARVGREDEKEDLVELQSLLC